MKGLAIIAAVARNGVIGRNGELPWRLPEDLRHFKRTTSGHAVIMGRKTHESIGFALPKRLNIVVTRQAGFDAPGCSVVHSMEEALALAWESDEEPFVIGGAGLYAAAVPLATRLVITEVQVEVEGDTFFPPVDFDLFDEVERRDAQGMSFVTWERSGRM
jgi:dihydrofolate reductase